MATYCYYSERRTETLARRIRVFPLLGMGVRIGNGESIIVASDCLGD